MVKGKDFIVNMRQRTARGIWKSPEQRETVVDWLWSTDWTVAMREAGTGQSRGRRGHT